MSSLVCDIVTPEARLYSEEAYMVVVPGVEGEMGYLESHVPLLSVLADGVVRIQKDKDGAEQQFVLQGGYVEVTGKKVIVLADRAKPVEAIDVAAVEAELADFEKKLAEESEDDAKKAVYESGIEWTKLQIAAAKK